MNIDANQIMSGCRIVLAAVRQEDDPFAADLSKGRMMDRGKSVPIADSMALAPLMSDRLEITTDFFLYARIQIENRLADSR